MILNRQRTVRVARPPLEQFLRRVREQLKLNGAEVTVCLVSDQAIAQMNETFRHKKGPTDVLSFPNDDRSAALVAPAPLPAVFSNDNCNSASKPNRMSRRGHVRAQDPCAPSPQDRSASKSRRLAQISPSTSDPHSLGDIAISPATARRYAKKNGRTLPSELQILILHGVLHLLGYDHETDNGQMTRVENRLRRKLGLQ